MPSLDGPRAKLHRAQEHLDNLNTEFAEFTKTHPILAQQEINSQEGTHKVRFKVPTPPDRLRLVFADFVCNLRFSLDHLAWELASLKPNPPYPRTEFPSIIRWDKSTAKDFARLTQSLPDGAREEIKALQPYHRVEGPEFHTLAILDYFCNIAKHRTIPMRGVNLHLKVVSSTTRYEILDDGTVEFTFPYKKNSNQTLEPT